MQRFAADAAIPYDKFVIPWSLAYVLIQALAGKPLDETGLKSLASGILKVIDAAYDSRDNAISVQSSPEFRAAVKNAMQTLLSLGVNPQTARIFGENLIVAGDRAASQPLLRPLQADGRRLQADR